MKKKVYSIVFRDVDTHLQRAFVRADNMTDAQAYLIDEMGMVEIKSISEEDVIII
jgi:hypothetical protein